MVIRLIGDGSLYFKMLQDAEKQTAATRSTVEKYAKQIEGFGTSLQKFGGKVAGVGKRMTVAITAPLTAINALAIKTGADFESGFAGVRKTVSATEEEFAMLKDGFKEMAKSTPVAVEELLRIGEAAGQLGIKTDAILDFTKTIAMLNVSTNLGEDGAEAMAKFANIIGMSQDKFQNLGSTLVELGNNLPTTENDIMRMSMRLAGMGKTLGFSVPQVTGLAAALSSVGLEAEMGGSAISTFMLDMATSVATGSDSLKEMAKVTGVSVEEFQTLFRKDAMGALMALLQGLNKLEGEAKIVALREMGVDGIRMSDALQRASGAVTLLKDSLNLSNKAFVENKALTKEAGERFKTFWSQVEQTKNQVKDLLTDAFDLMRPSLDSLIQSVRDGIKWIKGWSKESKIMAINVLKVTAVLGPLIAILGTLIVVVGAVVSGIGAIAGALAAVTIPVWGWIAAIVALLAALGGLTYWLVGSEGILNAFSILAARVQNFVFLAIAFLQNFRQNVAILSTWLVQNFTSIVGDLGELWGTLIAMWINNLAVGIETIIRVITVLAGWLVGVFSRVFTTDFVYAVAQGIIKALKLLQEFFTRIVIGLTNALSGKKVDFGAFMGRLSKDFKKGAEDLNPLDAIGDVLKEQMVKIDTDPFKNFQFRTAMPELALGGLENVPRNALADQSVVGAIATPLQASLQPNSPQMQAVDNLKNMAVDKTNVTLDAISGGIDRLVEIGEQSLANPTLDVESLGLEAR